MINSAPGVSATSNVGQSTSAQSLGSSTNENSYQIDGTDISSTPWLSTDAIEEVEVLQLGASAEYGNVQGAVFNIVTRQGSNLFHGDANVYYQIDSLTGRNTTDAADRGFPYHRDKWRDIDASRRPVRSCSTSFWFFGSLQYQRDWDSQPGVNPDYPAKNDTRRVFWKFNYNITPNHRLMHGYHDDYYFIPGVASAFTAPSTIDLSHGDNPTPNLVYTGVLSDKTIHRGAVLGLLAAQLQRSERDRPGARAAALRGPGHRPDHRRHQRLGREPQLALRLSGEAVAHDRPASRRQPRLEGRRAVHRRTAATTCRDRTTPILTYSVTRPPDHRHHPAAVHQGANALTHGAVCRRHLPARRAPR